MPTTPKDHAKGFRPFLKGPRTTPPGLRERIVNFTGTTERQQRRLIEAAEQLLRKGEAIDHDSLRRGDASLSLMDVLPQKLVEAANAVRTRNPRLADELALAGHVPVDQITQLRIDRADALLVPQGYTRRPGTPLGGRAGGRPDETWCRDLNDGSQILVMAAPGASPQGILPAPEAPVWGAARYDDFSTRISASDRLHSLPELIPILDRMRRETTR